MPSSYPPRKLLDWDDDLKGYIDGQDALAVQSANLDMNISTLVETEGSATRNSLDALYTGGGGGGAEPNITVFFAPGPDTFTPPTGAVWYRVHLMSAGGASGGSSIALASEVAKGGGGGSGAAVTIQLSASAVSGPVSVTVGAGGVGVSAGTGGSGGDTVWDVGGATEVTVTGGQGGAAMVGVDNVVGNATTATFPAGNGGTITGGLGLTGPPQHFWTGVAGTQGQIIQGQIVAGSGRGGTGPFGGASQLAVATSDLGSGGTAVAHDSTAGVPSDIVGVDGGGGWLVVESWF